MNDLFGAVRSWLAAQSEVTDLVGNRIFVNRIPRDVIEQQDTFRPEKMLVIGMAGGAGRADLQALDQPNLNILCYGETDLEADKLRRVVWDKFRLLSRVRESDVLIHHINPTGGPVFLRDPDIVWSAVTQQFSMLAATEA